MRDCILAILATNIKSLTGYGLSLSRPFYVTDHEARRPDKQLICLCFAWLR